MGNLKNYNLNMQRKIFTSALIAAGSDAAKLGAQRMWPECDSLITYDIDDTNDVAKLEAGLDLEAGERFCVLRTSSDGRNDSRYWNTSSCEYDQGKRILTSISLVDSD